MMDLDVKDKKILLELDRNSKQSIQAIAKKIRLSKDFVFYRIKRLERKGIIEKYQTVIDVGKLGYISFRIFYKLQNTTSEIEEEIVNFLKKQKLVAWMATIEGFWDINTWILCKEISKLEEFWREFNDRYINYLADKRLSIFTEIDYFARAYFLENKQNELSIRFVTAPSIPGADSTDLKILQILSLNARKPLLELSKRVGLSAKQVSARIRKLESKKIIVGYRTMFNLDKIGIKHYHMNIKVKDLTKEKDHSFRTFCFHHPNIIYTNYLICGSDLEIDFEVDSVEKLREIINEIKDKFSSIIQEYEVLHYLKQQKYIYMPSE